jgi:hypothetical protein
MKFLYFISLIVLATAYPTDDLEYREMSSGKFEGDMVLSPLQQQVIDGYYPRTGLINERYRWADAIVPYTLSAALSTAQRSYILAGLAELERTTCLKFVEKTAAHTDYVEVITTVGSGGCWSMVGRQGGRQQLHLQSYEPGLGCFRNGTIMHEFIHAIGFYHMQSAYDRDDFVQIVWENIQPGTENNFRKYDNTQISHFGVTYDYESVMHYPAVSFSINGEPTIIPLKADVAELGQRYGLTEGDIARINSMYCQ